jgi:flagellar biosynthesis protein FliP
MKKTWLSTGARILSICALGLPLRGATSSALPSLLPAGQSSLSTPMQIVILMTVLTLLPAIVMSLTPFLRISIVLHFLRQALGTQSAPSNQVLTGLALFLTLVSSCCSSCWWMAGILLSGR